MLKQLLADEMLSCILVDVKTHFKSRLARLVDFLLEEKKKDMSANSTHPNEEAYSQPTSAKKWIRMEKYEAFTIASRVFAERWTGVPSRKP